MIKKFKGAFAGDYKALDRKLASGIITKREYNSKIRTINKYKNTMTSTLKLLNEQKRLGNVNEEGLHLLKNDKDLKKYVIESYQKFPIDKLRTRNIAASLSNAGRIISEGVDKRTGESYIKMGSSLRNIYKFRRSAIDKFGAKENMSIRHTLISGRDEEGTPIFEDVNYNFDFSSEEAFIRSLSGTASVIALRIATGEDRDEVLDDYGY